MLRALAHHSGMSELIAFFQGNALRREVCARRPWIFEQVTRQVFYRGSTFRERLALIQQHHLLFESCFTEQALRQIYLGDGLPLWRGEFQNEPLVLSLRCNSRDRREGLLSVALQLGHYTVYRMIFWAGRDASGAVTLRIGSLHGARGRLKTYRDLTKHFFGYRPKNLVLFGLRLVARKLQAQHLQAISNAGFFTNNHLRVDRKLQTSLDEFWQETGGQPAADPRFYDLPMAEPRKRMEETKSHKHTLYRNRFALIDRIEQEINRALNGEPPSPPADQSTPPPAQAAAPATHGALSRHSRERVMAPS